MMALSEIGYSNICSNSQFTRIFLILVVHLARPFTCEMIGALGPAVHGDYMHRLFTDLNPIWMVSLVEKQTISYIYAVIMASLCGKRGLVLSVMGCLAHLASIASEPKIDPLWEYYDLIHSQEANVCTIPINRGQAVAEYIFEM